jgi:hypothetical protein
MTPYQHHLAEQASTEMNPQKLMNLVAALCSALDDEQAQNRQLRQGCLADCREHSKPFLGD